MSATYTEGERPEPANVDELIPVTSGVTSGDDKIKRSVNNILIQALGGNDSIVYTGSNSSISGGGGNDTIQTSGGQNNSISGGGGSDNIENHGNWTVIDGGLSGDYVKNLGAYVSISGGGGSDTVDNFGNSTTIDGGADDDYLVNDGEKVSINTGDGEDTVYNHTDDVTIRADNDDYINNGGSNVTIDGGDHIVNVGANVSINGGQYAFVDNRGNEVTISGGQLFSNTGNFVAIKGGTGRENFSNTGNFVSIDAGDGDDSIDNRTNNVTIDGGAGTDTIFSFGDSVTIDGGADNDYIFNQGANVSIDAGDGNNYISNELTPGNVTITAGAGDDVIKNDGRNVLFKYSGGLDKITGFNATSTLQIGDGNQTYATKQSGNNLIVKVGEGRITLENFSGTPNILGIETADPSPEEPDPVPETPEDIITTEGSITGTGNDDTLANYDTDNVKILAYAGNDVVNNWGNNVIISGGAGKDKITNYGEYDGGTNVSINAGTGADIVTNSGNSVTIRGGADDDFINNEGNNVKIFGDDGNDQIITAQLSTDVSISGGAGSDIITVRGQKISASGDDGDDYIIASDLSASITLSGGDGSDTIDNTGNFVTIRGGRGDDSIVNGGANVLFVYDEGDGIDTIYGFKEYSTLQIGDGTGTYSTQVDGTDIVVIAGDGAVILKDAASLLKLNINVPAGENSTIIALTEGKDTFENTLAGALVLGYGGGDSLNNIAKNSTIDGGTDDDFIENSAENALLLGNDGNDQFFNYGNNSTLSGDDGNDKINNSADNVSIGGGDGFDSIDNGGSNVTITSGGNKKDSIVNSGSNVTITGSTTNDVIKSNGGAQVSIDGGGGADYIILNKNSSFVTVTGGDGSDTVESNGTNITVDAGAGNDTIHNFATNALIKYSAGDGSDKITGFNATSTLQVGGTYSTTKSGNDIIVKVGDDSISLIGAASLSTVNITAGSGGDDSKLITLTEGDDLYSNTVDGATVQALGGKDTIINYGGTNVSIDGGTGDDRIWNEGNNVTINGGDGNDDIFNLYSDCDNVSIDAGDGNDNIGNEGDYATIDGGAGDDYIENTGTNVTIDAGDGNNSITNLGTNVTINGGRGNDSIVNYGGNNVTITTGAGDDTIIVDVLDPSFSFTVTDFSAGDVIELASSVSSITVVNNSLVAGSVTIGGINSLSEEQIVWAISGGIATCTKKTSGGVKLSDDGKTISFVEADKGSTLVTVRGVKSLDGLKLNGKVVTVSNSSIGDGDISISGTGYKLALGADVPISQTTDGGWKLSGTTATYLTGGTTEGCELSDDGKKISFVEANAGSTLVTVKGVTSLDGLKLNGKVVTVSNSSIGDEDISISGTGYKLALGDDVTIPQTTDGGWKLSGTTATYTSGGTSEGCELSDDGKKISFVEASDDGDALVTIDGMKSTKGLGVNGDTVKIDPKSIDSKSKCATVSGSDYTFELTGSGRLFAGENTVLKGSTKNDTLIADVAATLDGGAGKDVYVYGGGDVTVEYSAGDKVSLGAGIEIVGVAEDDDGISLTLSKDDEEFSLFLNGATSNTKVDLVTTSVVKGKNKATSANVYFADGMIVDNNTAAKIKKVTVFDGEADFSELAENGKNAKYKSLATITAAVENSVVGTEKNNTIVLQAGGAATGGLGNDTFIIVSGDATIEDFGIGATTPLQDGELVKLPKTLKTITDEDIYAPGTDTIKINGKITSATLTDGDDDSETFSVELSVTYDDGSEGIVTLENIKRDFKKNSAKNIKNGGDEFIPKNAIDKDLAKLKIFDTSSGKSKAVKWNKLPISNSDIPADDLMSDDNFTNDELGEIMTTPTSDALTGEIFTDAPTVIAPLQATFTNTTDK